MIRFLPHLLIAAALVSAGTWLYLSGRGDGSDAKEDQIEEQNNEAAEQADAASLGIAECSAADGVFWDFGASECRRGAPRRGR